MKIYTVIKTKIYESLQVANLLDLNFAYMCDN